MIDENQGAMDKLDVPARDRVTATGSYGLFGPVAINDGGGEGGI